MLTSSSTDAGTEDPTAGDGVRMGAVASSSSLIAGLTLLSRLTGFARALVIAATLGPTFLGNLFLATNSLPNLLYEFAIGSLLVSLLVPPIVEQLDLGEPERARRIANGMLGVLCVVFFAVTMLIVAVGPLVLRLLGAGIDDPAVLADQRRVGWPLLALVVPQALFYAVVGTSAAVQNARDRYALTAAAPVAENLGTIAVFAAFALIWKPGVDLHDITGPQVLFLGIGATSAVALHAAVQWWGAWRVGHLLVPTAGWKDPDVRALLLLGVRSLGYAGMNASRYVTALVASGSVQGGVVAYQLAVNFRDLPNALVSRPLSVASLPPLSRDAISRRWDRFFSLYRSTVRVSLLLQGLAAVCLVAMAPAIARSVAFGSMGTETGRALLVAALATMALGIIGDGTFVLSTNACYADRDARRPFQVMLFRTLAVIVGAVFAMQLDGRATLVGLGLSIAVTDLGAGYFLHRMLEQGKGRTDRGDVRRSVLRVVIAATAATAVAYGWQMVLRPGEATGRVVIVGWAASGLLLVAATYFATARLLRAPEWTELIELVPERWRSRVRRSSGRTGLTAGHLRGPLTAAALVLFAVAVGVGASILDVIVVGAVGAAVLFSAVFVRPALAASLWLLTSPILVGIERGAVIPLLRVNEALLAVLLAAVVARSLVTPRPFSGLRSTDLSVVAVAIAGSFVPLLVTYSRHGTVTMDEMVFAAPLVKLALVYALFRVALRRSHEVRSALIAGFVGTSIAAMIGFAQAIDVPGVRGFLASSLYANALDPATAIGSGRGTSTLGSAIGASGLYVGYLLIAAAWMQRPDAPRRFLFGASIILLLGVAGTAQFTALIALVAGGLAVFHILSRSTLDRRALDAVAQDQGVRLALGVGAVVSVLGVLFAFGPRLSGLIGGELPQSWTERWYNLSTHFLSPLGLNTNLLIGVSPVTQVPDPRGFVEWIWIESGYVQLAYTGGLILVASFLWMMQSHLAATWSARNRPDEFGVCASAAWTMGAVLLVIMVLDPHLTIRGTSDLLFALLAMGASASVAPAREPAQRQPVILFAPLRPSH